MSGRSIGRSSHVRDPSEARDVRSPHEQSSKRRRERRSLELSSRDNPRVSGARSVWETGPSVGARCLPSSSPFIKGFRWFFRIVVAKCIFRL